jgi:ABC-type phosphate/phosphonate transport system substrate-binding protein
VIIVRSSDQEIDYSQLSPDDVAFSSRGSINGYFVQASMLAERGFGIPKSPCELHFIGSEQDQSRVVLSVIHGRYRLGACRLSTLARLRKNGVIGESEITVVGRAEALPEMLIAVPAEHVAYYSKKLEHISNQLSEVVSPPRQNQTVELLKARGVVALEPVDIERIEQARQLFERYACPY